MASHSQNQGNKYTYVCLLARLPSARLLQSQTSQDPCLGNGAIHSGLDLLTSINLKKKKISLGDCEMIQGLDTLIALPEGPDLTPSTYVAANNCL